MNKIPVFLKTKSIATPPRCSRKWRSNASQSNKKATLRPHSPRLFLNDLPFVGDYGYVTVKKLAAFVLSKKCLVF